MPDIEFTDENGCHHLEVRRGAVYVDNELQHWDELFICISKIVDEDGGRDIVNSKEAMLCPKDAKILAIWLMWQYVPPFRQILKVILRCQRWFESIRYRR